MDEPAQHSAQAPALPENTAAGRERWQVLVLPDRDSAEELATALVEDHGITQEPQILREALAGEDDAEDAQWLVVLDASASTIDAQALQDLARSYEGWLEHD